MAFFDDVRPSPFALVANRISAALRRVWETPFDRRARRIAARIAYLRGLTDAELAARGLRRDQIITHVFAASR